MVFTFILIKINKKYWELFRFEFDYAHYENYDANYVIHLFFCIYFIHYFVYILSFFHIFRN